MGRRSKDTDVDYDKYDYRDITKTYVDITDPATGTWLSIADSFDAGAHWAWGYLRGQGSTVNDGREILVMHKSGKFQLIATGCVKEMGDDWAGSRLEIAFQKARAELDAHLDAQTGKTE